MAWDVLSLDVLSYIRFNHTVYHLIVNNAPIICIPRPSGPGNRPGNSGAFNFTIFKALLKALHCGAKFVVLSLQNAPVPGG